MSACSEIVLKGVSIAEEERECYCSLSIVLIEIVLVCLRLSCEVIENCFYLLLYCDKVEEAERRTVVTRLGGTR